ncbi:MAG: TetR/AcrR family transcriptional regulator [Thermaerobacter sp.]|nr:TetR/AcrR family transcriptional regulator [Thermaerobacter sp.]
MPKVSDDHKERRRQLILDAAQAVFLGKGYQLTTVDDIAARSGLSVGALYRYFPTKSDIMLTLVEQRLGRTPELLKRLTAEIEGPWERLSRCVEIFVSALRVRHPSTGRLLLVAWGEALQDTTVRQGLQRRFAALVDYLASVIQEGVRTREFRSDANVTALASILLSLADGVTLYWSAGTPEMDLHGMRSAVLAMLRAYLNPVVIREE